MAEQQAVIHVMETQGAYGHAAAAVVAITLGARVEGIVGPHVGLAGSMDEAPWDQLITVTTCAERLAPRRQQEGAISAELMAECITVLTEGPVFAEIREHQPQGGWAPYVQQAAEQAARWLDDPRTWRAVIALAGQLELRPDMNDEEVHAIVDPALS